MGRNRNENKYSPSGNPILNHRLQPIYDIAEVCARKGIRDAVLCPGSRCAPLTTAFARHPGINSKSISDERSAAFIGNGIAMATDKTVVLVCTSGSAAYNFAPAVAEAFYQHIPVLILTADRPKEWINQLDGQTIMQSGIFGNHVKHSYELPQDYNHTDAAWQINRIVNEAINLASEFPKGPVHINIPLREPLYLAEGENFTFSNNIKIFDKVPVNKKIADDAVEELKRTIGTHHKILVVAGQEKSDPSLAPILQQFSVDQQIPIITDVISNLHVLPNGICHADLILGQCNTDIKKALQPELLITFGKSVISKNLKLFLRQFSPKNHWHIQPGGEVADTYQSLTTIIPISPQTFFDQFGSTVLKKGFEAQKRENYYRLWDAEEHRTKRTINSFFSAPALSELSLVNEILKNLPKNSNLHLANSMAVRYVDYIGIPSDKKDVEVYCNRGTSGIDGCSSTAVGCALANDKPTILITGDMAMLYDRNAFWHNYKLPNLRIVVLNNHGGAIFSMIDGPSNLPEADEYFITKQKGNAKALAAEYDFDYLNLDSLKKIKNLLRDFFDFDGRTKILEIESKTSEAKVMLNEFKRQIRKNYEA